MTHEEKRQRRETLANNVRGGMTLEQAARRSGLSTAWARRACEEHDVVLPDRRTDKLSHSTYVLIGKLCTSNTPLNQLAQERGISRQAVSAIYRKCLDANIPVKVRKQHEESGDE